MAKNKSTNLRKVYLKGMNLDEVKSWCIQRGESQYRGTQLFEWMYKKGISSFDEIINVKKIFIDYLKANCILQTLKIIQKLQSKTDGSVKILFCTHDNNFIETVSMLEDKRHTVCISSQAGCSLDCDFCATGKYGVGRNLTTGEIVDQLIYIRKHIKSPITNVVFMGMGEPFLNYRNVMNAADIMHSPKGFNLASSRITISTAGILPGIEQFIAEKRKFKLAISLNAPFDNLRDKIMPINKKWPIAKLIKAAKKYSTQKKCVVMFEYVLLKGINDTEEHAKELAKLLSGIECKLNIIPYNEAVTDYLCPEKKIIIKFSNMLHKKRDKFRVLVRWSKGQDINAGCGQLAGQQNISGNL